MSNETSRSRRRQIISKAWRHKTFQTNNRGVSLPILLELIPMNWNNLSKYFRCPPNPHYLFTAQFEQLNGNNRHCIAFINYRNIHIFIYPITITGKLSTQSESQEFYRHCKSRWFYKIIAMVQVRSSEGDCTDATTELQALCESLNRARCETKVRPARYWTIDWSSSRWTTTPQPRKTTTKVRGWRGGEQLFKGGFRCS